MRGAAIGSRDGVPLAWRSALGFLLLLVVLAPLTLWRSHLETSLWIDESYSLLLTTYPVDQIVALTGADAHPPGYYLALKAWLKAGRLLGFEPGVLWARLLNGTLWVLLAALAWFAGRRFAGRRAGTILAWVVVGGAYAALVARELRGYGMATVFLFGAYLALVAVAAPPAAERRSKRVVWALWGVYALCASLALWAHVLSALVLAALSLAWLAVLGARRRLTGAALMPAAAGHVLVLILTSPWLVRIADQVAYLRQSDPQWMTPPTLANLGWVFAFWYPFGRIGDPAWVGNRLLVPLGLAALLLPMALTLVALGWPRKLPSAAVRTPAGGRDAALASGAMLGLGGAVLYVVAIWWLDRAGLAHTFHGPRYPVLGVHLWSAGLVGLTAWATGRRGCRRRWVVLAFVPWLLASGIGQIRLAQQERRGQLTALKTEAASFWPAQGETLYFMPPELAPFYHRSLRGLEVRRIERLPCEAGAGASVAILDANFWRELDRPRDHLVRALLDRRLMGRETRKIVSSARQAAYTLYRVEGLDGGLLSELCRRGLSPPLRDHMVGSVSEAMPEDQLATGLWSYLEVSPELEIYRWSTAERTPVAFDRRLPAGAYTLHVVGYRPPYPQALAPVRFTLEAGGLAEDRAVAAGRFHLRFQTTLPTPSSSPVLTVQHPTWRPADHGGNDDRTLSFLLYGAWFTPAGAGHGGSQGGAGG